MIGFLCDHVLPARCAELRPWVFLHHSCSTVDGRNPAPADMENIPEFTGFYIYTSQVVQDFFHQQYHADQVPVRGFRHFCAENPPRMQRKSTSEEPTESWWGWPWNPKKLRDELASFLLFIMVLTFIPSSKSVCLDCTAKQIRYVCVYQRPKLCSLVLGNPLHGSSWKKKAQNQTHSLFRFGDPPKGGWHLRHFFDGPGIYISYNNTVDGRNPVPVDR